MREALYMADVKLKYLLKDIDRHGNVRWYVRKRGAPKARLEGVPGSEEFAASYHAALLGVRSTSASNKQPTKPNSFRWLVEQYYGAACYTTLEPSTRHARKLILDKLCNAETEAEGYPRYGDLPFKQMRKSDVRRIRDAKAADTPEAANDWLKAVRQVFKFAVDDELIEHSPAESVGYIASKSQGFHTWTVEEIRQYERRHPVGTQARLALALLTFLGQRRSDVVRFGEHMVRLVDGQRKIKFIQHKGRNTKPVELELPILPELDAIISATPRVVKKGAVSLTWLQTEHGLAFTAPGFGNKMRDWCNQADLPHCSAHGVRKAGATIAAENGASTHDLNSIFGWRTLKEAFRYTEAVRQKKLAEGSMHKIIPAQSENKSVPLSEGVEKSLRKRGNKS